MTGPFILHWAMAVWEQPAYPTQYMTLPWFDSQMQMYQPWLQQTLVHIGRTQRQHLRVLHMMEKYKLTKR